MKPETERELSQLTDRLARLEPRLSDLASERVLARIHAEVDVDIPSARRERVSMLGWSALLATAAASFVWWSVDSRSHEPVAMDPVLIESPRRGVTPTLSTLELVPYLFSGGTAARADALLGHAHVAIELARGERLLASLGGRARFALVGPAGLRVRRAQGSRVEIELDHGLLLGDYDHDQGGELFIVSPGTQTRVVGTLFLVRALEARSQVAVARGRVLVHAGAQSIDLDTGRAWSPDLSTTEVLSAGDATELALLERSLRPSTAAHGVLGITGERLEAEVGDRWLGATPLWAVLPAGSNTIVLRDVRDRSRTLRSLQTSVRSAERTELVLEPIRGTSDRKPRATRSAPTPHEPVAPPEPSAESLYAAAEQSMREGDIARASELLEQLLARFPSAPNGDLARYDLALVAYKQSRYSRAIELLEQQPMRPPLREVSAYLRCRAVRGRNPEQAPACFEEFRRRFPQSPHANEK